MVVGEEDQAEEEEEEEEDVVDKEDFVMNSSVRETVGLETLVDFNMLGHFRRLAVLRKVQHRTCGPILQ